MADPGPVAVTWVRLSYADCDPAGIIYYASWFVVMERQLSAWFFAAGFRFDTMLAEVGDTKAAMDAFQRAGASTGLGATVHIVADEPIESAQ